MVTETEKVVVTRVDTELIVEPRFITQTLNDNKVGHTIFRQRKISI